MDHVDATIALELIGDYWPGKGLSADQVDRWADALTPFDFDHTCEHIAHLGSVRLTPPTLAELCAALSPVVSNQPPPLEPHADGWTPTERGRAMAAHARHILDAGTRRKDLHDHRHGSVLCPVCMNPGDYRRCGEPTCSVCG